MPQLKSIEVTVIVGTTRDKIPRDLSKEDDESVYEFKKRVCRVIDEALERGGVR